MANIKVYLKTGKVHDQPHRGRAGGGYTPSVKFEGGFVIVKDEWDNVVAFPAQDVERVEATPVRSW